MPRPSSIFHLPSPILAEAAAHLPDPGSAQAVGWVVIILMFLINGTAALITVLSSRSSQKRVVEFEQKFAAVEDFREHNTLNREEHEAIRRNLEGIERGMRAELKSEVNQIYEKVNKIDRDQSAIASETKHQSTDLAYLRSVVDRLLAIARDEK